MNSINEFIPVSLNTKESQIQSKHANVGKILVGITGGIALGLTVISAPFLAPAFRKICLPYIPATTNQLHNIIKALNGRKGSLIDLGSGDGRVVFETAKHNFVAHGIELNSVLVFFSKLQAFKLGLTKQVKFFRKNLWNYNLSKYDNIIIFGVEEMMKDLECKFIRECKNNCNVIACRFPLPNKEPIRIIGHGIDTVWVYRF